MKKCLITINREYGSGGRLVAKALAEKMGVPFYDEEIINMMVKQTGLADDFIKNRETKRHASFFSNLTFSYDNLDIDDQISVSETDIIRKIASRTDSCVIVGLGADYILRDLDNVINVFIHAPVKERIRRVEDVYKINHKNTEKYIKKVDRGRKRYYSYQTSRDFDSVLNYDLVINSSIGIDVCTELIYSFVQIKENKLNEQR